MSNGGGTSCPKCQKSNPPGSKFCSGCGSNLGVAPVPPPTPPPMPPPRPQQYGSANMGHSGGKSFTRQFNGEANDLYAIAMRFVENQKESEVTYQFPPHQLRANLTFKDFWKTGGVAVLFDSDIQITPTTPGQCSVSFNAKVEWSSTIAIFSGWVVLLILPFIGIGLIFMPPMIWLILCAVGAAFSAWELSSNAPKKISDGLFDSMRQHAAAAPQSHAQPVSRPKTTPPSVPAPTPTPPEPKKDPMAHIKQLFELKEQGAISAEEFEAKKAALLKNIQ